MSDSRMENKGGVVRWHWSRAAYGNQLLAAMLAAAVLTGCGSERGEESSAHSAQSPQTAAVPATRLPETAPPPVPQPSRAAMALDAARSKSREEQKQIIADLILDGLFSNIELHQGTPRVFLRPAFYLLSSEDQHGYLAVVYAFAYPENGEKVVELFDSASNTRRGTFSPAGLQLN